MDDEDKVTDTVVPYDHLTSKTRLLETIPQLEQCSDETDETNSEDSAGEATTRMQVLEARAILEELAEGTTIQHRYQPNEPRLSWLWRLLNWFRRV